MPLSQFLLMADDAILDELRPRLEQRLAGRTSLGTALHGMLEVLPLGASKAVGLTHALKSVGVSPAHVMAAGDGEGPITEGEREGEGGRQWRGSKRRAGSREKVGVTGKGGGERAGK